MGLFVHETAGRTAQFIFAAVSAISPPAGLGGVVEGERYPLPSPGWEPETPNAGLLGLRSGGRELILVHSTGAVVVVLSGDV
jgi:hypothetical protein